MKKCLQSLWKETTHRLEGNRKRKASTLWALLRPVKMATYLHWKLWTFSPSLTILSCNLWQPLQEIGRWRLEKIHHNCLRIRPQMLKRMIFFLYKGKITRWQTTTSIIKKSELRMSQSGYGRLIIQTTIIAQLSYLSIPPWVTKTSLMVTMRRIARDLMIQETAMRS